MLYQKVHDDLLQSIHNGVYTAGAQLPSVADLCEHYAVSAITIRRALDMLRDEGYIKRQPRIGTTVIRTEPDDSAAAHQLPILGLIMTNFDDTFGTKILEGALDAAVDHAHLLLKRTHGIADLECSLIESAVSAGAKGIILLPSNSGFIPKPILELISRRFPVTILDRRFDGVPVDTVTSDNINGALDATRYLFSLGHRHVALLSSDNHVTSNDDRQRGWEAAHATANVALDTSLAFHGVRSTLPDSKEPHNNDIRRITAFVKAHPEVTAFLANEYNIALMLREALQSLGRHIPQDASVICFDHPDDPFDSAAFRFTHVKQDQRALGQSAVLSTLHQLSNGSHAERTIIPTSLCMGDSTAPVRL